MRKDYLRVQAVLLLLLLLGGGGAAASESEPEDLRSQPATQSVYQYRMKGKVRLLFFWVGKDDVGGGHIALGRRPLESGWEEEIEVLFGSNPERVPGGINRWGYGRERGRWADTTAGAGLESSVFEGFLKHSKEESLDEVKTNEAARDGDVFWYDGIRSRVMRSEAISEIRYFPAAGDFDYRDPSRVHCSYQERLAQGQPPDKSKRLENARSYEAPYGFLTGVHHLINQLLEHSNRSASWRTFRPWTPYVYNAQVYRLRVSDVDIDKKFDLPLRDGSRRTFRKVAKVQFVLRKDSTGDEHAFNLWIPLQGPYRGIPIRIVDKPRWWLRVELNLEPERSVVEATGAQTLATVKCED